MGEKNKSLVQEKAPSRDDKGAELYNLLISSDKQNYKQDTVIKQSDWTRGIPGVVVKDSNSTGKLH